MRRETKKAIGKKLLIIMAVLFLLVMTVGIASAQKIYISPVRENAMLVIYITQNEYEADWVVMKTEYENQAGQGVWFFTKWEKFSNLSIYITDKKYEANKIIFFTKYRSKIRCNK